MPDEPIPGVDPTPGATRMPLEWIGTTGPVKWVSVKRPREQCDDCRRLLVDEVHGAQEFDRPVGAPLPAVWRRIQQGCVTNHCVGHFHARNGAT